MTNQVMFMIAAVISRINRVMPSAGQLAAAGVAGFHHPKIISRFRATFLSLEISVKKVTR
jgi:hypothetical protein